MVVSGIAASLKRLGIGYLRLVLFLCAITGIFGVLNGDYAGAAILFAFPVLYYSWQAWDGYRDPNPG